MATLLGSNVRTQTGQKQGHFTTELLAAAVNFVRTNQPRFCDWDVEFVRVCGGGRKREGGGSELLSPPFFPLGEKEKNQKKWTKDSKKGLKWNLFLCVKKGQDNFLRIVFIFLSRFFFVCKKNKDSNFISRCVRRLEEEEEKSNLHLFLFVN